MGERLDPRIIQELLRQKLEAQQPEAEAQGQRIRQAMAEANAQEPQAADIQDRLAELEGQDLKRKMQFRALQSLQKGE